MSAAPFPQAFDAARGRLPDAERARRAAAWRALESAGLPTTRLEDWRYTDLKAVAGRSFEWLPPPPDAAALSRVAARLAEAGLAGTTRAVVVDGHYVPTLGTAPAIEGMSLVLDPAGMPRGDTAQDQRPLAFLNTAFTPGTLRLRVAARQRVATPIEIVLIASGAANVAPQARIVVELEAGAAVTLVQRCLDCGNTDGWLNSVVEIDQAEGSELTWLRLQEHGRPMTHTASISATLAAGAHLRAGFVDLGGSLVRTDVAVRLLEPRAHAELYGVFIAATGQHVDNHTRIDHVGAETTSDEAFRGIVGHRGRGVFNGKVVVHRNAQRIDARQSSDNLLLSDQAEIDTKPELEIHADDVKCSHGSTVGELDTEQLFYLRARGIGEPEARALLTVAFADTVLARIADTDLRTAVSARVAARLAEIAGAVS